jgi:hypothetical protein
MIRTIIDIPPSLMKLDASDLEINVRGRSGGTSSTGVDHVIYGSQPRWEGKVSLLLPYKNDVLAWRALYSKIKGRVNLFKFRIVDPHGPEIPSANGVITASGNNSVPHSDNSTFSDGAGYAYEPRLSLKSDLSVGDTSLTIDASTIGDALQVGHYFSIDDWPYRIVAIYGTESAREYHFEPPLRRAAASGDILKVWAEIIAGFETDLAANPALVTGDIVRTEFKILEWINRP